MQHHPPGFDSTLASDVEDTRNEKGAEMGVGGADRAPWEVTTIAGVGTFRTACLPSPSTKRSDGPIRLSLEHVNICSCLFISRALLYDSNFIYPQGMMLHATRCQRFLRLVAA